MDAIPRFTGLERVASKASLIRGHTAVLEHRRLLDAICRRLPPEVAGKLVLEVCQKRGTASAEKRVEKDGRAAWECEINW